jgi:hypothetical protein
VTWTSRSRYQDVTVQVGDSLGLVQIELEHLPSYSVVDPQVMPSKEVKRVEIESSADIYRWGS